MERNQEFLDGKLRIKNGILLRGNYRNFEGRKTLYTPEGVRYFNVLIDDDIADVLKADKWNVKYTKQNPNDKDYVPRAFLKVNVSYAKFAPTVYMITGTRQTPLNMRNIKMLDYAEIESADIIINPSHWTNPKKETGISAYLFKIWVTIYEDEFEKRHPYIPESMIDDGDNEQG